MAEGRAAGEGAGVGQPVVVVGVDGSAPSMHAVRWAAPEALRQGAVLRILGAWLPPTPMVPVLSGQAHPYAESALGHVRQAAALADEVAPGVEFETEVVELPPAQALLASARRAGLLVVGRRGQGGLRGLLLGSVSRQCAEHAACPVVVVPGPET